MIKAMEKKFVINFSDLQQNPDGMYMLATMPTEEFVPSEYTAITPIDGRYFNTVKRLSEYTSEMALVRYRAIIEVMWLKYLRDSHVSPFLQQVTDDQIYMICCICENFDKDAFFKVKEIEKKTNHDVKSVEYWLGDLVDKNNLGQIKSFIHIGCTSEDITNCAYAMMIQDSLSNVWVPEAEKLISKLSEMANNYKDVAMLAHTHGQPATPTTLGKEFLVYVNRLKKELEKIKYKDIVAKWNGATGNYSAISFAFPKENWIDNSKDFVENYLGFKFNPITTQIESHDCFCEIAADMQQFNRIVSNLCSDMWTYISMEFFKQVPVKTEVGSSTMPHKVNPIDFENGEANLRKSTEDLEFMREQLTSSRMQRDLRDSTVQRNIGPAFAYSLLGIERTLKGLNKVEVNEEAISKKLKNKYEILAEPIQTILRKYGVPDAYDRLKEMTRGRRITKKAIHEFLKSDEIKSIIPKEDRKRLLKLTPEKYVGMAVEIVDHYFKSDL